MKVHTVIIILIVSLASTAFALKPNEILIVANGNNPASIRIAEYYCRKRAVPKENILKLTFSKPLADDISRADYEKLIAEPVRKRLSSQESPVKIKCLLTIYGVPFRVKGRGMLESEAENLTRLKSMFRQGKNQLEGVIRQLDALNKIKSDQTKIFTKSQSVNEMIIKTNTRIGNAYAGILKIKDQSRQQKLKKWLRLCAEILGKGKEWQKTARRIGLPAEISAAEQREYTKCAKIINQYQQEKWGVGKKIDGGFYQAFEKVTGLNGILTILNDDIKNIEGVDTHASVDSELSMVISDDYSLYRWKPNELKRRILWIRLKTLMVSRLDGPGEDVITALVDKAISAEQNGLNGNVYIDSGYSKTKSASMPLYAEYDKSLAETVAMIRKRTTMEVVHERSKGLFKAGQCPNTALYCGWYSLRQYVDAFDFVDGAVGFHIASLEAVDLRNPNSTQWCPAMLKDGITATIGAVAEPYLAAFPKPKKFFSYLLRGKCLAETFYRTKPYNSWQMVLIGDPLYTPFKK